MKSWTDVAYELVGYIGAALILMVLGSCLLLDQHPEWISGNPPERPAVGR